MMLNGQSLTAAQCRGQQPSGPPVQLGSERQPPPDERALGAPQDVAPSDQSLLLLLRQIEAALQDIFFLNVKGLSVLQCGPLSGFSG